MNKLLEQLRSEFLDLQEKVRSTQDGAADAGRDLEEAEQANVDAWLERSTALKPRIEHLAEQEKSFASTAEVLAGVTQTLPPPSTPTPLATTRPGGAVPGGDDATKAEILRSHPTPGAYIIDLMAAGDNKDAAARLARTRELSRALAHQTTVDNPGIIPVPIVEPVVSAIDATRPVWESFTSRPMPRAGKKFTRPFITTHALVGKQTAEKTEIASRTMKIDPIEVSKETYGGGLNISQQDIDWTDPALLDIALSDLADAYYIETDAAASALLVAAATATQELPDDADPEAVNAAMYAAAAMVYAGSKRLPNRLWVSVDQWARLGSLTDTTGRAIFPAIGPMNAPGTMSVESFGGQPFGVPLVVGPNFPEGTMIMGANHFTESFEQIGGAIQAREVSLLGWEVGFYGYAAATVLLPAALVALKDSTP